VLALSNWTLDSPVPAQAFQPLNLAGAARIAFERPDASNARGFIPPPNVTHSDSH